jgi:hypothetical protein
MVLRWSRRLVSVLIVAIGIGIRSKDGTESLLLSLCENTLGSLVVAWLKMVGLVTTGSVGVLVVVAVVLGRECEATGFVNVQEMAFEFGEWWQRFVIQFCATYVGVKTLIGCGVEGVIASTTNGAFDKFGVSVWYSSMIAVARENADAVEVGGCDFMMWLFD